MTRENVNDKAAHKIEIIPATKLCCLADRIIVALGLQFSFYVPWISEPLTGSFLNSFIVLCK